MHVSIRRVSRVSRDFFIKMWYRIVPFVIVCSVTYILRIILTKKTNTLNNCLQYYLKYFTYYFATSLAALVMLPYYMIRPRDSGNVRTTAHYLKHVTKLCQIEWQLRNGHILAEDRPAVVVSNHQSSLDILGMFNIWEVADKIAVIAKKELFYIWPFGLSGYLSGAMLFVDRQNTKNAYDQLDEASKVMVQNQTKIWLFPEGTRNRDYTKLLPFKKGAFSMAVRAQVPIIPVLYSPYYFINPSKNLFKKGHVIIKCLEPIPTKGLTRKDLPDLMDRVYNLMLAEYKELSKEVLNALPSDYPHSING